MSDVFDEEKRSEVMSQIGSKDTGPELAVRKRLWRRGLRYRVHVDDVPGTPDICHKTAQLAVFIDGCFWHGCPDCYSAPDTNTEFWEDKIEENRQRRAEVMEALREGEWAVLQFWECEVENNPERVVDEIEGVLRDRRSD